jgi:hypothetical protein
MVCVVAAAVALVPAAAEAEAACGGVEQARPLKLRRPGPPPLAVGDSVMLGAVEQLRRAGIEVNTRGCRQMSEGLQVIASRRRSNSLPGVVVLALGTNWTVSTSQVRAALHMLGPRRVLGLVTMPEADGAPSSDHAVIRAAGRRWPARVKVLDWVAYSSGRDWTWDGMHLKPGGAVAFARLLRRAFTWPIPGTTMTLEHEGTPERTESVRPAPRPAAG